MLTVLCVLRSGGKVYSSEWVAKLRDGVARNMGKHRFACLSDVEVPCERIPLQHEWAGWWAKVELFRPGVIEGPTLYLDLDTVITGPIFIQPTEADFAMLQSFWQHDMVGSGVMWFSGENVPHHVYSKFVKQPRAYMAHYERNRDGVYVGDQAFIRDTIGDTEASPIARVNDFIPGIKSYKMHCFRRLPQDASIVCFHGVPRPTEVDHDWMRQHWRTTEQPMTESDVA